MNKLILMIALFSESALSAGDYLYIRASYGVAFNNIQTLQYQKEFSAYDAITLVVGYKWKMSESVFLDTQYAHGSQLFTNIPFNSRTEITSEIFTIGLEYRWH